MKLTAEQLHEILVVPGHISDEVFHDVVEEASSRNESIVEELIDSGLISDENLGRAIAGHFDYRFATLEEGEIEDEWLAVLPEIVARAQRSIVFGILPDKIKLATENIDNYEFQKLIEKKTGKELELYYTTASRLDKALRYYKGDLHEKIENLITTSVEATEEGSIVSLVDLLLEYGADNRASDIHIEPYESETIIRYRVDGILHEVVRYPKVLHEKIVFRIKIMSHLQTDEHGAAQDGRFDFVANETQYDVRVSILPITEGENVVMRLLDSHTHKFSLETLGLAASDYQKIMRASDKPHGMILAVGPTGSGKTTVLYTILDKLNSPEVNITTIEDPVEYAIEGVQQTQVNPKKDLTFSRGLRSIVRQDPDIIMVGEIRDEETADIAINAALTGHLLLSTLHTNDAATTFPRLMEMNVEPFLIASSVNVIVAVRLVRRICKHCKESYVPDKNDLEVMEANPEIVGYIERISGDTDLSSLRLFRGVGCKLCGHSGYVGRTGIFEILEMTDELRLLVTQKASADVIDAKAKEEGMTSLFHDGITKVLEGVTTIDEVLRAART